MQVKYICNNCGHAEPKSKKRKIMESMRNMLLSSAITLSIIFLVFVVQYCSVFGTNPMPLQSMANMIYASDMIDLTDQDILNVRPLTLAITAECKDSDMCRIHTIHEWVHNNITYINDPALFHASDTYFSISTILSSSHGDCDDKARLEIAMLRSVGISAFPVITKNHLMACATTASGGSVMLDPTNYRTAGFFYSDGYVYGVDESTTND